MRKKYNTPHRRHVVKTRMTDEEYADFTGRLAAYEISQSEFIRQAIRKATIRPIVTVSPVNDGLLAALSKLTAEYGKIGGNQIQKRFDCLQSYNHFRKACIADKAIISGIVKPSLSKFF